MWLAALLPLLSSLPGVIGDYFKKQSEIAKEQLELQRDIIQAKREMATELAKAEVEDNINKRSITSSKFKYVTFIMWFGPYCIGLVSPELSGRIFDNLSTMPEWYVQSCLTLMFTVWGISVSAPVISNIFSGLNSYLADRNERQVEKIKALNQKSFYDSLRSSLGALTQRQVNAINVALKKGSE